MLIMDVLPRRLALVQHRHFPAHGLLSFLSLLRAFLLNATMKRHPQGLRLVHSSTFGTARSCPSITLHSPWPVVRNAMENRPIAAVMIGYAGGGVRRSQGRSWLPAFYGRQLCQLLRGRLRPLSACAPARRVGRARLGGLRHVGLPTVQPLVPDGDSHASCKVPR